MKNTVWNEKYGVKWKIQCEMKNTVWTIPSLHCYVGHTAWAPEGREGRYQAGPKGRNL